jgi:hypothetical protein
MILSNVEIHRALDEKRLVLEPVTVETVKGVPFRNDSQFQGQHAAGGNI